VPVLRRAYSRNDAPGACLVDSLELGKRHPVVRAQCFHVSLVLLVERVAGGVVYQDDLRCEGRHLAVLDAANAFEANRRKIQSVPSSIL
jgi:hypothetical protein